VLQFYNGKKLMGKRRRDRERGVKQALYEVNAQLTGIVNALEKRAAAAEEEVDEGERILAKETAQHRACMSDAFFGAYMAKVGKMTRAETCGYRKTDATMSTTGVEVAVVARGAISPPLLQGLVAEIPRSDKGWEPMQHDLSIYKERGISKDNVRLEARGNQRSTKGVPCTCTHSLTCALGESSWNKCLLQLREAFVNTENVKVRLETHTKGGNVVLLASSSFVSRLLPCSSNTFIWTRGRKNRFHT